MRRAASIALSVLLAGASLEAHDGASDHTHAGNVEPVAYGLPDSRVNIFEKGGKRIVEGNGIPNHPTGRFPNRGNPNEIQPQRVHFEMPIHPVANATFTPVVGMVFGVARNGVKFDAGTAEFWGRDPRTPWRMEAIVKGRGTLGIDKNNAHVQPTGTYHYHGIPVGLIDQLGGRDKMILIGWAADGFPIYGPLAPRDPRDGSSPLVKMRPSYRLKEGNRPGGNQGPGGRFDGTYTPDYEFVEGSGDLDAANGREGVTPEYPDGTYYYVLTEEFPYVPRFFRGTPDPSFRLGPPGAGRRGDRRRPPPGGGPPPPL